MGKPGVIWLNQEENLYLLAALMAAEPASQLFLVLPERGKFARNLLAWRILDQFAALLDKKVIFISAEAALRESLRRADLAYLPKLPSLSTQPLPVTAPTPAAVSRPTPASVKPWRRTWRLKLLPLVSLAPILGLGALKWGVTLAAGLFLLLVIFQVALAKVEILVTLKTTPFEATFPVSLVDRNNNLISGPNLLRGELVEVVATETENFPASGSKNIGSRARGEVLFSNRSGERFSLKAGTKLTAANGRNFLLEKGLTLPPATVSRSGEVIAGEARAAVVAEEGGATYNLLAGEFSLPALGALAPLVSARTLGPFSGGVDQIIKIVTAEDLTQAQENLQARLRQQLEKTLVRQIPAGKVVYPGTMRESVVEVLPSHRENEEAENFDLKMSFRLWSLALPPNELPALIEELTSSQLKSGEKLTPDSLTNFRLEVKSENFVQREMKGEVKLRGRVAFRLERERLKESFRRKSFAWVRDTISRYPDVVGVEIRRIGFWGKSMPWLSRNIGIRELYQS